MTSWAADVSRFSGELVFVGQDRLILTCSRSGDPELLRLILFQTNEGSRGTGPRATVAAAFFSRNNLDKKRDIC